MDTETSSHSFLVRLWVEDVDRDAGSIHWRGHVTHLIDEEREHVESFDQLVVFIQRYLNRSAGPGFERMRSDPPAGTA